MAEKLTEIKDKVADKISEMTGNKSPQDQDPYCAIVRWRHSTGTFRLAHVAQDAAYTGLVLTWTQRHLVSKRLCTYAKTDRLCAAGAR